MDRSPARQTDQPQSGDTHPTPPVHDGLLSPELSQSQTTSPPIPGQLETNTLPIPSASATPPSPQDRLLFPKYEEYVYGLDIDQLLDTTVPIPAEVLKVALADPSWRLAQSGLRWFVVDGNSAAGAVWTEMPKDHIILYKQAVFKNRTLIEELADRLCIPQVFDDRQLDFGLVYNQLRAAAEEDYYEKGKPFSDLFLWNLIEPLRALVARRMALTNPTVRSPQALEAINRTRELLRVFAERSATQGPVPQLAEIMASEPRPVSVFMNSRG